MTDRIANPSRRAVLGAAGALFTWSFLPRFAHASGSRDPRFVVIVLRGALDGLTAVPPVGDPSYREIRQAIALQTNGAHPTLKLDGFFALDPSMPNFARLYHARQAAVVHACATAYRDRSHFDGQDVLESGWPVPGHVETGWLNRLLLTLPTGERVLPGKSQGSRGLAVGANAPLVIRGKAPVLGWAPATLKPVDGELPQRLMDLYQHTDPLFARLLGEGIATGKIASGMAMKARGGPGGGPGDPNGMEQMASGAARLLAQPDGPRIAALAFDGWDTHAQEIPRLSRLLMGLDKSFAAFEHEMGPAWKDTVIVAVTEFGRTAHVNGTSGTDHGTGTTMFLAGGAVRGGRIVADWPGLRPNQLRDGRDLAGTTDMRAVLKGISVDLLDAPSAALARDVFPGSEKVAPMKGLIV
jgi:uncharacterized protein (DUF1501 family)